jgi:probable HAF family extracellular repeat protein
MSASAIGAYVARWWVLPVLAALIGLRPSESEAQTYKITNLGTLCQSTSAEDCFASPFGSRAFDINNSGQVVGVAHGENDGEFLGCFRTAAHEPINPATDRITVWDPREHIGCLAYGINDDGAVVGAAANTFEREDLLDAIHPAALLVSPNGEAALLPFILDCPSPLDHPAPYPFGCPLSAAFAINNTGRIVGKANTGEIYYPAPYHAFRLAQEMQDLGALPLPDSSGWSEARAINDLGVIVGSASGGPGGVVQRAVRFGGGSAHDLGTLGHDTCTFCSGAAYGINNVVSNANVLGPKGQVVGWSTLSVSGPRHAFFLDLGARRGRGMRDLGDLCKGTEHGLCWSAAFAINDVGQIVGESQFAFGSETTHAFIYRVQTGIMQYLNNHLSSVDRVLWDLTDAVAVNDLGQIIGTGLYIGRVFAYRLDPPPFHLAENLDNVLDLFNLVDRGIEQSLRATLRATRDALARDDRPGACGQANAFDHHARAQAGRGLTARQAKTLLSGAALLRRDLECR